MVTGQESSPQDKQANVLKCLEFFHIFRWKDQDPTTLTNISVLSREIKCCQRQVRSDGSVWKMPVSSPVSLLMMRMVVPPRCCQHWDIFCDKSGCLTVWKVPYGWGWLPFFLIVSTNSNIDSEAARYLLDRQIALVKTIWYHNTKFFEMERRDESQTDFASCLIKYCLIPLCLSPLSSTLGYKRNQLEVYAMCHVNVILMAEWIMYGVHSIHWMILCQVAFWLPGVVVIEIAFIHTSMSQGSSRFWWRWMFKYRSSKYNKIQYDPALMCFMMLLFLLLRMIL